MPPGRPKTKTAAMNLRVEPGIKAAVELAAKRERRSVTSMVELLILNHCRAVDIPVPALGADEETSK
jgi:hypothetical protein